jgi:hypothetical protein
VREVELCTRTAIRLSRSARRRRRRKVALKLLKPELAAVLGADRSSRRTVAENVEQSEGATARSVVASRRRDR